MGISRPQIIASVTVRFSGGSSLANTKLDAALETIADNDVRSIIHSDGGGHYQWPGWLECVIAAGIIRSMSRKASSQDNAACQEFFGRLKTEFFYPCDWRAFTLAQFNDAVGVYIRWYNETRIKLSLGGRSHIEYRKSLGLMPSNQSKFLSAPPPRGSLLTGNQHNQESRMSVPISSNKGYCPCCNHYVDFNLWGSWHRDLYLCGRCGSIPRERALINAIKTFYPDWCNLHIHESSPAARGASVTISQACTHYTSTQYHPDVPEGSLHPVQGWRCENLERQTFDDQMFDLVITQDVLEHVFDPDAVMREIARTLKPGGAHIGTTPLVRGRNPSIPRAVRLADGTIEHLADVPEYHGNPVDQGGALVTFWWGYDLANRIDTSAPLNTLIYHRVDPSLGIEGALTEVLISFKI